MAAKLPKDWKPIGAALTKAPRPVLTKLIRELYDLHPDVRKFLHARYAPTPAADPSVLAEHRKTLNNLLASPSNGYLARFPFTEVRDLVRNYEKASVDADGATALLLEAAYRGLKLAVSNEMDGRYADGLYSLLNYLHKRLTTPEGRHLARKYQEEIRELATPAGRIAYGFGDEVPVWIDQILTDLPPEEPKRRYDGDPDFDSV
jgi:hypothetical protein